MFGWEKKREEKKKLNGGEMNFKTTLLFVSL